MVLDQILIAAVLVRFPAEIPVERLQTEGNIFHRGLPGDPVPQGETAQQIQIELLGAVVETAAGIGQLIHQMFGRLQHRIKKDVGITGVLGEKLLPAVQQLLKIFPGVLGVQRLCQQIIRQLFVTDLYTVEVEVIFALEIVIEQPFGDLAGFADVVDGGGIVALAAKLQDRRGEDPLSGLSGFLLLVHGGNLLKKLTAWSIILKQTERSTNKL